MRYFQCWRCGAAVWAYPDGTSPPHECDPVEVERLRAIDREPLLDFIKRTLRKRFRRRGRDEESE